MTFVERMTSCMSEPQLTMFGKTPPRTPGRSDSQAPAEPSLGDAKHARLPHLYFYAEARRDDPMFGLLDIEISIQLRKNGSVWLEAYCVGDGFQSGFASGVQHPLTIAIMSGIETLGEVRWNYPAVLCGHFDPMTFAIKTNLTASQFASADRVFLPATAALAGSCNGADPTMGAPGGHDH